MNQNTQGTSISSIPQDKVRLQADHVRVIWSSCPQSGFSDILYHQEFPHELILAYPRVKHIMLEFPSEYASIKSMNHLLHSYYKFAFQEFHLGLYILDSGGNCYNLKLCFHCRSLMCVITSQFRRQGLYHDIPVTTKHSFQVQHSLFQDKGYLSKC